MNLVKSTGTFGFYTIISRLLGYLRDILIAIFLVQVLLLMSFLLLLQVQILYIDYLLKVLFDNLAFNSATESA